MVPEQLNLHRMDHNMAKVTIDTHTLELIPEEHRENATAYEAPNGLWTQKDSDDGFLPEGVSVGDIREPAHTRYTVSYEEA